VGDLEKARTEYEKIAVLTTGRKFLDLRKNADANLPEPAAARKRLSDLRKASVDRRLQVVSSLVKTTR